MKGLGFKEFTQVIYFLVLVIFCVTFLVQCAPDRFTLDETVAEAISDDIAADEISDSDSQETADDLNADINVSDEFGDVSTTGTVEISGETVDVYEPSTDDSLDTDVVVGTSDDEDFGDGEYDAEPDGYVAEPEDMDGDDAVIVVEDEEYDGPLLDSDLASDYLDRVTGHIHSSNDNSVSGVNPQDFNVGGVIQVAEEDDEGTSSVTIDPDSAVFYPNFDRTVRHW